MAYRTDDIEHRTACRRDLVCARLHAVFGFGHQGTDFPGRLRTALGELPHFGGHDGKSPPLFARPGRLDARVDREDIGLESNAVEYAQDVGNPARSFADAAHAADYLFHHAAATVGNLGRIHGQRIGLLSIVAILADGHGQLLHAGRRFLDFAGLLVGPLRQMQHAAGDFTHGRLDQVGCLMDVPNDVDQAMDGVPGMALHVTEDTVQGRALCRLESSFGKQGKRPGDFLHAAAAIAEQLVDAGRDVAVEAAFVVQRQFVVEHAGRRTMHQCGNFCLGGKLVRAVTPFHGVAQELSLRIFHPGCADLQFQVAIRRFPPCWPRQRRQSLRQRRMHRAAQAVAMAARQRFVDGAVHPWRCLQSCLQGFLHAAVQQPDMQIFADQHQVL